MLYTELVICPKCSVSIDNVVLSSLVEHGDTSLQTNEQLFEQDGGEIVTDLPKDSTMTGDSTLAGTFLSRYLSSLQRQVIM